MRLDGKVAVVTGGAGGIGRGIVRAFIDDGASVVFADVAAESGRALETELGDRANYIDIDITKDDSAEAICQRAIETFGALHVLVNNAHVSRQAPLIDTSREMFDLSFETGFFATVRLMKAAYSHLRATEGSVINFASGAGLDGHRTQASYAAAKEAIRAVSRVVANEWADDNINVNVISPLALTEGVQGYIEANPGMEETLLRNVPMHRFGDPQHDIGRVAVFLASADAAYITGQTIMVDGGAVKLR